MIFIVREKHSLSHNLNISRTLNKKLTYPRNNLASQLSTSTKTVFCSLLARLPASLQPLHAHSDLTKGMAAIARGPPSFFARCFLVSTSCAQNQRRIKRPSEQAGPLKAALSSEGGQRKGRGLTLWSANDWRLYIMKLNCWRRRARGLSSREVNFLSRCEARRGQQVLHDPRGHASFSIIPL